MDRRDFLHSALAAGVLGTTGRPAIDGDHRRAADERRHYELRTYELRSDLEPARLHAYLRSTLRPALARAGAGALGFFSPDTGFPSQSVIALIEYPSLAAVASVGAALDADAALQTARRAFESAAEVPYVRYDAQLMRAFSAHRAVEVPAGDADRPARMFELRTYEARSGSALERKIAMFNDAEIMLFRRLGMTPVLFGENLFGSRLPSLTYMLTFADLAARQHAWATFRAHPDWLELRKDPRYNDIPGSVTVTNVAYLTPLPFSPVR